MLGMSMRGLGKAAGLASAQMHKYEHGTSQVTLLRLCEFGRLLDVPVSYFFEGVLPRRRPRDQRDGFRLERTSGDQLLADRQIREFVRAYYMIRETAVRKRIHQVVLALSQAGHVQGTLSSKGRRKRG